MLVKTRMSWKISWTLQKQTQTLSFWRFSFILKFCCDNLNTLYLFSQDIESCPVEFKYHILIAPWKSLVHISRCLSKQLTSQNCTVSLSQMQHRLLASLLPPSAPATLTVRDSLSRWSCESSPFFLRQILWSWSNSNITISWQSYNQPYTLSICHCLLAPFHVEEI